MIKKSSTTKKSGSSGNIKSGLTPSKFMALKTKIRQWKKDGYELSPGYENGKLVFINAINYDDEDMEGISVVGINVAQRDEIIDLAKFQEDFGPIRKDLASVRKSRRF